MLKVVYTTSFKKDFKKIVKQNQKLEKIKPVMKALSLGADLETRYRDHPLVGNYKGKRECHIAPDWLLIYEINKEEDELVLHRTGTHSELFKK